MSSHTPTPIPVPRRDRQRDSTYAIRIAKGAHLPRKANAELGRHVRAAYGKLIKARGAHAVHLHHVRAHTRVAGNELVDRLAKAAAADATITGDGPIVRHLAEREYALACSPSASTDASRSWWRTSRGCLRPSSLGAASLAEGTR